jgi:hypothetical protein
VVYRYLLAVVKNIDRIGESVRGIRVEDYSYGDNGEARDGIESMQKKDEGKSCEEPGKEVKAFIDDGVDERMKEGKATKDTAMCETSVMKKTDDMVPQWVSF